MSENLNKKLREKIKAFLITYFFFVGLTDASTITIETSGEIDAVLDYQEAEASIVITKCNEDAEGALVIPSLIGGKPVTSIGENAFNLCVQLTQIVIPEGVSVIDKFAFARCTRLREVSLPDGLISINYRAFYYCVELADVRLPESVTTIEDNAFAFCTALRNISIPRNVVKVGFGAFIRCLSLVNVFVDGRNGFYTDNDGALFTKDLRELIFFPPNRSGLYAIPDDVESVKAYAFDSTGLESVVFNSGLLSIGEKAFQKCSQLSSVVLPEGIEFIEPSTFLECSQLVSVTIPSSINSIGESAFASCVNLSSFVFKGSAPSVGSDAFLLVSGDANAFVKPEFAEGFGGYGALWNGLVVEESSIIIETTGEVDATLYYSERDGLITITGCNKDVAGSLAIPYSIEGNVVSAIGEDAFDSCSNLTHVLLPEGVSFIGKHAFARCSTLESINIPSGVVEIGYRAFFFCDLLASISFPEALLKIGDNAFAYCDSLSSVSIPQNVADIGEGVFVRCALLESIDVDQRNENYSSLDGVLFTGDLTELIFSPPNRQGSYEIPQSVQVIAWYAFDSSGLASITIPNSVTQIGEKAFQKSTSLTSVVLSDSITSIASGLFIDCSQLMKITIPEGVTVIGDNAFERSGLEEIVIPSTVESIGDNAFLLSRNLRDLIFEGSAPQVSSGTFSFVASDATVSVNAQFIDSYGGFGASWNGLAVVLSTTPGQGGTVVSVSNAKLPIEGYAIVDNTGRAISGTDANFWVGTFDNEFAATLGTLDSYTADQEVFDHFTAAGNPGSFLTDGFFNNTVNVDLDGALGSASAPLYVLLTYQPEEADLEVIVFDFGGGITFPEQNDLGAGSIDLGFVDPNDVLFGNTASVPVDVSSLPEVFQSNPSFSNGITFNNFVVVSTGGVDATLKYAVDGGQITITECNKDVSGSLTIPDFISGRPIVAIGKSAFEDCVDLEGLTIPGSIKTIGLRALYGCNRLRELDIPEGVITIDDNALAFCGSLSELFIPQSVKVIGSGAFIRCLNLENVIVHEQNDYYTSVDGVLFDEDKAELIFFPPNRGGDYVIPNSVQAIQHHAFDSAGISDIQIPNSVNVIGERAFQKCHSLTTLRLPDSVEAIAQATFFECSGLTKVFIPYSVTLIETDAFASCSNLDEILIEGAAPIIKGDSFSGVAGASVLVTPRYSEDFDAVWGGLNVQQPSIQITGSNGLSSLYYLEYDGEVIVTGCHESFSGLLTIPDLIKGNLVTSVGREAFRNNSSLTGVVLPIWLRVIDKFGFEGCDNLKAVSMAKGLITIGYRAFNECEKLESIIIPESVAIIDDNAFASCSSLESISIPNNVEKIGSGAFIRCLNMANVFVDGRNTSYSSLGGVLFNKEKTTLLFFPPNRDGDYTVPNGVRSIQGYAFDSAGISSVLIAESVSAIGEKAFQKCQNLTEVIIPEGVGSIESALFLGCSNLESVTLPSTIDSIGSNVFFSCAKLSEIVFEGDVPSLQDNSFSSLSSATEAVVRPQYASSFGGYESIWEGLVVQRNTPRRNLSVGVSGNGVVNGGGVYRVGRRVVLTATPNLGHTFINWTGGDIGSQNPAVFSMQDSLTITAVFEQDTDDPDDDGLSNYEELVLYNTNPNDPDSDNDGFVDGVEQGEGTDPNNESSYPTRTLTLVDSSNGAVFGGGVYRLNEVATIAATPNLGYIFNKWSGIPDGSTTPLAVTMSEDFEITASFIPDIRDPDNDGLSNYDEIIVHQSNPNKTDTDGDGFNDGFEVLNKTDLKSISSIPLMDLSVKVSKVAGGLFGLLKITSPVGGTLAIEETTDLKNWSKIESFVGNGEQFTKSIQPTGKGVYYRLRLLDQSQ